MLDHGDLDVRPIHVRARHSRRRRGVRHALTTVQLAVPAALYLGQRDTDVGSSVRATALVPAAVHVPSDSTNNDVGRRVPPRLDVRYRRRSGDGAHQHDRPGVWRLLGHSVRGKRSVCPGAGVQPRCVVRDGASNRDRRPGVLPSLRVPTVGVFCRTGDTVDRRGVCDGHQLHGALLGGHTGVDGLGSHVPAALHCVHRHPIDATANHARRLPGVHVSDPADHHTVEPGHDLVWPAELDAGGSSDQCARSGCCRVAQDSAGPAAGDAGRSGDAGRKRRPYPDHARGASAHTHHAGGSTRGHRGRAPGAAVRHRAGQLPWCVFDGTSPSSSLMQSRSGVELGSYLPSTFYSFIT
eukprot:m.236983 g.236983  ORF g.236983 m.236983 type:complete len:353 (+) comp26194_c0_seq1:1473-2531(+)